MFKGEPMRWRYIHLWTTNQKQEDEIYVIQELLIWKSKDKDPIKNY